MKDVANNIWLREVILYIFLTGNLFVAFLMGAMNFGYLKILQGILSALGMSYYLLSLCVLYQMSRISGNGTRIAGFTLLIISVLFSLTAFALIGVSNPFYVFTLYLAANVYVCTGTALLLGVIVYLKLFPILKTHVRIGLKEYG